MQTQIAIIAHNLRSTHNVGSLLRTADGLGIDTIFFTVYTPYPQSNHDSRLPHIAAKLEKDINKTALGAQNSVTWEQHDDITDVLSKLRTDGYVIAGLEQTPGSTPLPGFTPPAKLAILLGSEVTGIEQQLIPELDVCLEIPMVGAKESFNVIEAATMAMYQCKLASQI